MKILEKNRAMVALRLRQEDIVLIANALNETLEALEDWEIPIRVGADSTEVEELQKQFRSVLAEMKDLDN